MRKWLILFLCPLLLFLGQLSAQAAELGGVWKYRVGNSPHDEISDVAWAYSAMWGDETWKEFPFPEQPDVDRDEHYVWMTTKLLPDEPQKNALFFFFF